MYFRTFWGLPETRPLEDSYGAHSWFEMYHRIDIFFHLVRYKIPERFIFKFYANFREDVFSNIEETFGRLSFFLKKVIRRALGLGNSIQGIYFPSYLVGFGWYTNSGKMYF